MSARVVLAPNLYPMNGKRFELEVDIRLHSSSPLLYTIPSFRLSTFISNSILPVSEFEFFDTFESRHSLY